MDVSDIFIYFFLLGVGQGALRGARRGWGGGVLLKIPGGGLGFQEGEGLRGREGVCGELGNFGEGDRAKRPPTIYYHGQPNYYSRGRCGHEILENPNLLK